MKKLLLGILMLIGSIQIMAFEKNGFKNTFSTRRDILTITVKDAKSDQLAGKVIMKISGENFTAKEVSEIYNLDAEFNGDLAFFKEENGFYSLSPTSGVLNYYVYSYTRTSEAIKWVSENDEQITKEMKKYLNY